MGAALRRSEVRFRPGRRDEVRQIHRGAVAQIRGVRRILVVLLDRRDPLGRRVRRSRSARYAWDVWGEGLLEIVRLVAALPVCAEDSSRDRVWGGDRRSVCRVECRQLLRPGYRYLPREPLGSRWAPYKPGGDLFAA